MDVRARNGDHIRQQRQLLHCREEWGRLLSDTHTHSENKYVREAGNSSSFLSSEPSFSIATQTVHLPA
jgi:hypothetical protein